MGGLRTREGILVGNLDKRIHLGELGEGRNIIINLISNNLMRKLKLIWLRYESVIGSCQTGINLRVP
jgi:hypothetical protein